MRTDKEHEAVARRAMERPAPGLSDAALMAQYGGLVRATGEGLRAAFAHPRPVDLAVAAVVRAGRTAYAVLGRAVEAAGAMAGALEMPEPAYATRGIGGRGAGGAGGGVARLEALKPTAGGEARLRVALESEGTRRDLRVGLEDAAGRRLAPMELTVVDGENGKRLLDGARYGSGEAVMRGLEDGVYELSAESGDEVAVFTLKIGGTGGGEA